MENYKVKVNNWDESKEVQELFINLGYSFVNNIACEKGYIVASQSSSGINFDYWADVKEITLQYLRDLVILKRNSINDARFKDTFGDIWYVDSTNSYWMFENGTWREAEEPLFKLEIIEKPIKKEGEVKMKKKEYLELQDDGSYELVLAYRKEGNSWIEVPEGAEIFLRDKCFGEDIFYFIKHDGEVFHEYYTNATDVSNNAWIKGTIKELHKDMGEVLWERNLTKTDTSIQEKIKFIEKWLNGEKIQYILGDISEKTQWHNFTEGAMQYIRRSDIKFREAPKYVTINGIEFKNVKSLLKHVKNNFDLEDGE